MPRNERVSVLALINEVLDLDEASGARSGDAELTAEGSLDLANQFRCGRGLNAGAVFQHAGAAILRALPSYHLHLRSCFRILARKNMCELLPSRIVVPENAAANRADSMNQRISRKITSFDCCFSLLRHVRHLHRSPRIPELELFAIASESVLKPDSERGAISM